MTLDPEAVVEVEAVTGSTTLGVSLTTGSVVGGVTTGWACLSANEVPNSTITNTER